MKKRQSILFLLLLALPISSCGNKTITYTYDDYLMDINVSNTEGFKILQLNDLHYGMSTNLDYEFLYMDTLLDRARPNLIVIDGDMFMSSTKDVVKRAVKYFKEKKINWTVTFGNHDKQGFYNPNYVSNLLEDTDNCYFKNLVKDDVYGDSNFYININNGSGTKWQLYLIDSNSYHFEWTKYEYDVIHDDQIEWYKNAVNETTTRNGKIIPSLAFFHIPTEEWDVAIKQHGYEVGNFDTEVTGLDRIDVNKGNSYAMGHMAEPSYDGYKPNEFIETALELGSTKAVFTAHDHVNAFALDYVYNEKQIILSYGLKTGDCLYHTEDKIGGQLITLHDDETFSLEHIYQTYEGIANE